MIYKLTSIPKTAKRLVLSGFLCAFTCAGIHSAWSADADLTADSSGINGSTGGGGGRSAALPHYNRANRYLSQGRFEDAERDLLEAIRLYPDEPDFHTNLGVTYRKLNRYADAEKEFKIAIAYNRDDWENWSNLANAYLKQDMLEKTVATFEETLKHHPPATEQAAIRQDIIDIKKVLANRQPPAPVRDPLINAAASKSKNKATGFSAKGNARSDTTKQGTSAKLKNHSPTSQPPEVATPDTTSMPSSQSKQKDWGY